MAKARAAKREKERDAEESDCRMAPARVQEALRSDDPLLQYTTRKNTIISVTITLKRSRELTAKELSACFQLLEASSSADYRASSAGWHPKAKLGEMKDSQMWYLLARQTIPNELESNKSTVTVGPSNCESAPVCGFLSCMFTHDDDPPERTVLYIYEVHLAEQIRGSGLGSHLIHTAETLAKRCGIDKVMLTVFTANERALKLYKHLGYLKDPCSPADRAVRRRVIEAEYKILSKEHKI